MNNLMYTYSRGPKREGEGKMEDGNWKEKREGKGKGRERANGK